MSENQQTLEEFAESEQRARTRNAYNVLVWLRTVRMPEADRQAIYERILARPLKPFVRESVATLVKDRPERDPDRVYQDEILRQERAHETNSYVRDLYNSGDLRTEQIIDYGAKR